MSPGQLARRILGPRFFKPVGRAWRALFVDMERVAESFPPLPENARVLEIGGGGGQLMNVLLRRFAGIRATMIDIAPVLGADLDAELCSRVEVMPNTSIRDYVALGRAAPDVIVVCDVLHHVPPAMRGPFFTDLAALLGPNTILLVKDVRPGSPRALLGKMADRYITGDHNVSLLDESAVEALAATSLPSLIPRRTPLFTWDPPNYSILFSPR